MARPSTSSSCPAGSTSTRAATRCGWRSTTRAELAAGGHGARGRLLPQALHRLGGGKSEISKSLVDAVLPGSFFVRSFDEDMEPGGDPPAELRRRPITGERGPRGPLARALARLGGEAAHAEPGRLHAGVQRLAGEHPNHIRALVFIIKRSTGRSGATTGCRTSAWTSSTARRGTSSSTRDGSWSPTTSASGATGTAPGGPTSCGRISSRPTRCRWRTTSPPRSWSPRAAGRPPGEYDGHPSLKLAQNCEFRLFQRPDDAVHPGLDRQAEKDMASAGLFCSNFQPLDRRRHARHPRGRRGPRRVHPADAGARGPERRSRTEGMVDLLRAAADHRRKPTKNPRYPQLRPDMARPRDRYVAEMGARLSRRLPLSAPVHFPVIAVMSGRRNNPAEPGMRRSACTGRSTTRSCPSCSWTTSARSRGRRRARRGGLGGRAHQGAVQRPRRDRRPEQRAGLLPPHRVRRVQLRRGIRGAALSGGPRHQPVDPGDLVPALPHERDPRHLIEAGHLERLDGLRARREAGAGEPARLADHGEVRAHVLRAGVRQSDRGVHRRHPQARAAGPGGVRRRRREHRGSAEARRACTSRTDDRGLPPTAPGADPHHAHGHFEGRDASDPAIRGMFTRESLLTSEWYAER